ncbi:MAG: hypothetical protein JNL83_11565 [Myxococcales bacterium]|nr:hypothetical protein [Myxococcales bacterium]
MWWRRVRYVLLLAALCAIATCPAAKRSCTARNRAAEAEQLLAYLAEKVTLSYLATGKLPPGAGPTPRPSCCDQGGACSPDPSTWSAPGWVALGFSIDDEYRYTYEYAPDPSGTSATLRAVGDLDCDEKTSKYEVKLTVSAGAVLQAWTETDPYE